MSYYGNLKIYTDKYEFLILIDSPNEIEFTSMFIKEIYRKLIEIVSQYDLSSRFNYLPNKTKGNLRVRLKNGYDNNYFSSLLDEVENEVNMNTVLRKGDVYDKLIKIITDIRVFINSYDIPGVVDYWVQINPKLKYFDYVYDTYKDELELYYKILNGDCKVKFRFGAISKKEFEERENYFASNIDGVSESRLFQNELISTIRNVFRIEFKEFIK